MKKLIVLLISIYLSGCSFAIDSFSESLNKSVKSNNDIETIKQGIPAYIVLMNSLIESDPENEETLRSSAELMNSYASLISVELEQADKISDYHRQKVEKQREILVSQSFNNAQMAACIYDDKYCNLDKVTFQTLEEIVAEADEDDIEYIYSLAQSWLSWLQLNSEDWNNTARIPHIKLLFETVLRVDESWQSGSTYMYLGVMNSLLPESYGGKPKIAKQQFIKAFEMSKNKNHMSKVLYAEYYARLVYDEELHDKLLNEVLSANLAKDEFLLMNTIAIEKAMLLKNSAKDYF